MSIDVAIPNYNYGRYLRECIDSALMQDVENLRVLVIDNASTDESRDIAREIARADPRVEIRLREQNLGPHASFNEAIDWAASDYFTILCSDDCLAPGALRRAMAVLEENPNLAFVYGKDTPLHENEPKAEIADIPSARYQTVSGHYFIERFCKRGVFQIPGATMVVRTSAQKAAGHYRPELPHSDDYDLWLRLAMLGDVAELDTVQAMLRIHSANRSNTFARLQIDHIAHTEMAVDCFFSHEGTQLEDWRRLRKLARRGLSSRAYWAALAALARAEPESWQLMQYAIRRDPIAALLPPVDYLLARADTLNRIRATLLAPVPPARIGGAPTPG